VVSLQFFLPKLCALLTSPTRASARCTSAYFQECRATGKKKRKKEDKEAENKSGAFLVCNLEAVISHLNRIPAILTEIFRGFAKPLRQTPRQYYNILGHNRFLQYYFLFVAQLYSMSY
jgi:hypothetical protein